MKQIITAAFICGALAAAIPASVAAREAPPAAAAVEAAAKIGEKAPDFTLTDTNGKAHSLGDYKGKIVVLEWTNHECPFVAKHYDSGNMQIKQREAAEKGVVWLTVNSSAPGKQGHTTPEQANAIMKKAKSAEAARLLDADGKVGRLYGATTTPHMYVIDKTGTLVYAGAIDSNPSSDPKTLGNANNYVSTAIAELVTGQPVTTAQTKSYGCAIKYAE